LAYTLFASGRSLELRQAIVAQQFSQILSPGALLLFEKSRLKRQRISGASLFGRTVLLIRVV
jgi:hypothetical protein